MPDYLKGACIERFKQVRSFSVFVVRTTPNIYMTMIVKENEIIHVCSQSFFSATGKRKAWNRSLKAFNWMKSVCMKNDDFPPFFIWKY